MIVSLSLVFRPWPNSSIVIHIFIYIYRLNFSSFKLKKTNRGFDFVYSVRKLLVVASHSPSEQLAKDTLLYQL